MDPLSVTAATAAVVGLVGSILHGSRRLFEFIDGLQGAPKDIATLSTDLKAFYEVLGVLMGMQDEFTRSNSLCDWLRTPLENCLDIFEEFTVTLHTYTQTTRDGSVKIRTWRNIAWAFREKEVQLFRDTIVTYKASLSIAVGAFTLSTTASIDERTKRMENDFREEMRHIRSKLQALDVDRIELASISGRRGSEWHGTDTGFALGRFLDYTGSLYNSPPPSLTGSPIIPPLDSGSDVDTTTETLHSEMQSGDSNENDDTTFTSVDRSDDHEGEASGLSMIENEVVKMTGREMTSDNFALDAVAKRMGGTLTERLHDVQIEWPKDHGRYFIPINILDQLVTVESVRVELQRIFPILGEREITLYAERICATSRNIFALLLYTSETQSQSILQFVDEGITDLDLPFVRVYSTMANTRNSGPVYSLCRKDHGRKPEGHVSCGIKAVSSWSQRDLGSLCRDQWVVQAPVFRKVADTIPHLDLDHNAVLPFTEDHENSGARQGYGYGKVWAVRIHPAHQYIYETTNPQVREPLLAVKRLTSTNAWDFDIELFTHRALQPRKHSHIVKLLATYKLRGCYHLLFPYANFNLHTYFHSVGMPYRNRETYLWVISQMSGIASGLDALHNFNNTTSLGSHEINRGRAPIQQSKPGRLMDRSTEDKFGIHSDLKPQNILWFSETENIDNRGVLRIAGFRHARFHSLESRSRVDPRAMSVSPTYAAPEVMLGRTVSRAYDIWSLGCVFLEFITWLLEGIEGINRFAMARLNLSLDGVSDDSFFTQNFPNPGRSHASAEIRESVTAWIKRLHQNQRYSSMVSEILDLISQRMLRVESSDRIPSDELTSQLERILERATENSEYLIGVNPPREDIGAGIKKPQANVENHSVDSYEVPQNWQVM